MSLDPDTQKLFECFSEDERELLSEIIIATEKTDDYTIKEIVAGLIYTIGLRNKEIQNIEERIISLETKLLEKEVD